MPGDHVVTGVLRGIGFRIPSWVRPLRARINNSENVYVRLPNGYGLSSGLNETLHLENDITVHRFRCYIPITSNVILTAILEPYHYNQHFFSTPRVFVLMPNHGGIIYTGLLRHGYNFTDNTVRKICTK